MPKTPGRPVKKRVSQSQKSGRTWRIKPGDIGLRYIRTPSSLRLFLTFAFVIIGGFILLALPVASRGEPTSLTDALFTSTSAVCVTGLSVVDTAQHWNFFGQLVILLLMQVGGFGFMTGATLLFLAFGRKFSLRERLIIGRSVGLTRIGGLVTLVKQMALFTISVEAVGTLFFYWRFYSHYSPLDALWRALFHSVSSFNNAGFGILGGFSMADYRSDAPTVLGTAVLIIIGGLSFIVIANIWGSYRKRRWSLSLDTKIVLSVTAFLLVVGTGVMLVAFQQGGDTVSHLSSPAGVLNAFFQSVTSRTTGFSTFDMSQLPQWGLFFVMGLMFIGGAAGSTAGGIKVNTAGIIAVHVWNTLRGRQQDSVFGRELDAEQVRRATAMVIMAILFVGVAIMLLALIERQGFFNLAFEAVSAFSTTGLSTGVTPLLTTAGKLIIIVTMFIGRLGPLALVLALSGKQSSTGFRYAEEEVRIG